MSLNSDLQDKAYKRQKRLLADEMQNAIYSNTDRIQELIGVTHFGKIQSLIEGVMKASYEMGKIMGEVEVVYMRKARD